MYRRKVNSVDTLDQHLRTCGYENLDPGLGQLHKNISYAQIAQLVEQWTENPRVTGSIPVLGTINARVAQW